MRVSMIAIATLALTAAVTQARSSSSSSKNGGSFVITVNGPVPAPAPAPPSPGSNTLVDLVVGTPILSTLLDSVVKTGLAPTLASPGPFTVFAPNNAAFAAIAQLASTLTIEQLQDVLLLHVVVGLQIKASDLYDGLVITTANNGKLIVRKTAMGWKITNADGTSSANIILADQFASNGVAHVIDGVILPPTNTPPPVPTPAPYTPPPPSPPSPPSPPVYTCLGTRKKACKSQLTNGACAWNRDVRQCRPVNYAVPCSQQRKMSCKQSNSCDWVRGQGCADKSAAAPPPVCEHLGMNPCNRAATCRWQARKSQCKTKY